ncbi:MAG: carboxypeptidase-like regulatory domain-containing protein, partial [Candidatus Dojkabacteria bacterium]|nr:carboxypeptidase-like regulatory domain-containing protein [Candidatus Dojkabacteria bacterium]
KSLDPGLTYSFRAKAINSANVETSFVESNTGKTYSIIINKPDNISTVLVDDQNVDVSNVNGAQTGTQKVRILDNEYIVADLPISFETNRDWSSAIVLSSPENSKTVIKLNNSHGLTSKFTMYIVKRENDNALRVCPEARSLEEVNERCNKGVLFTGTFPKKQKIAGEDITVSQAAISGVTYWIADGLTGTGAQGEHIEKAVAPSVGSIKDTFFNTVDNIITQTVESIDGTAIGNIEKEKLTTVSATATAVTVSVGLTSIIGGIGQLGYSISQIFINLFSLIGLRRKRYPLGYVYDSITKKPIQQAIIRVYDLSGKLVDTAVTDGYGLFRTAVKAGEYTLEAKKRDFSFPSKLILGKEDFPMSDIYHGEKIILKENETNIVIPLDPLEESTQKRILTLFKSLFSSLLPLLNLTLFVVGVTLSSYVYIKNQNITNMLILLLYIPTTYILLKNLIGRGRKTGKVVFTDGTPASNVTLILKDKDFDKVISKRVTDDKGRYSFNISEKGKYVIESADTGIKIVEGKVDVLTKGRALINRNYKVTRI